MLPIELSTIRGREVYVSHIRKDISLTIHVVISMYMCIRVYVYKYL